MLETLICIILLPVAICAAVFTVALGIGIIKSFKRKK